MPKIDLHIPEQSISEGHHTEITPEDVKHWLADLRTDKTFEAAGTVCLLLEELNRSVLYKIGRYQLMENFRPTVDLLCKQLVEKYVNESLPLSEQSLVIVGTVRRLLDGLVSGYKIIVSRLIEKVEEGLSENNAIALHLAIQRAIICMGKELLEYYRVYLPAPSHIWRDMNLIYLHAEKLNIQTRVAPGIPDDQETVLSIKQAYLRNQILAMVNPYHLQQCEIAQIYSRAGRWGNFVRISDLASPKDAVGQFLVDLNSNQSATYVPNADLGEVKIGRTIDVSNLVQVLDKQIRADTETIQKPCPATTNYVGSHQRDLYLRLKRALNRQASRSSERQPIPDSLQVIQGYKMSHHFLGGEKSFAPEKEEQTWSRRVLDIANIDLTKIQNMTEARQVDSNSWYQKDMSAEGLALYTEGKDAINVRVGELMAYDFAGDSDPRDWKLGVVRWLRCKTESGVEIGIQCLAENAWAVASKKMRTQSSEGGEQYYRTFIAPRVNLMEQPATLISPADAYRCNDVVMVNLPKEIVHVKLVDLIETTPQFDRFNITMLHLIDKH